MGYKKKYERGVIFYNEDGIVYRKTYCHSISRCNKMVKAYVSLHPNCSARKFDDTKIMLGLECKSCGEKIKEKERWGKETLCRGCEDAIKYGQSITM